jgi:acyl carrier protein
VGLVRFNGRQWVEFYPSAAGTPFLVDVMKRDAASGQSALLAKGMRDRLQLAQAYERLPLLEKLLMEQVGIVLHLDTSRIDRMAPLQSLGMDSLMSLELRNRLEASLGLKLSATVMFTYPTVCALAELLLSRIEVVQQNRGEVEPPPVLEANQSAYVEMERELDELSDDELMSRLADKLSGTMNAHEKNEEEGAQ